MDGFEARFRQHLENARQDKKLRVKQTFFNIRMYYVLPFLLSMTVANLVAHTLYNPKEAIVGWVTAALGSTIVLMPLAYWLFGRNKSFDRQRFYMLDALQKTMNEAESDRDHQNP